MSKGERNGTVPSVLAKAQALVPQDTQGMKLYPNLSECLQPKWEGGKCVRQSGKIQMRIVGCYFILTLTCPTEGLETSVTLDSITGALEALEKHIVSPGAIWTPTFDRVKEAKKEEKAIRDALKKGQSKDGR